MEKIIVELEAKTDKALKGIEKVGKEVEDLNKEVVADSDANGINDLVMKLEAIFTDSARINFQVIEGVPGSVLPETTEEDVVTSDIAGDEVTGAVVGGGRSGWSKALMVVVILAVVLTIGYLAFTGGGKKLTSKLKRRGQFVFLFYF